MEFEPSYLNGKASLDKPSHNVSNRSRPSSATTQGSNSFAQAGINPHSSNATFPCKVPTNSASRPKSAPTNRAQHYWRPTIHFTPRLRGHERDCAGAELFSETPPASAKKAAHAVMDELSPSRHHPRLSLNERPTALSLLRRRRRSGNPQRRPAGN